MVNRSASCKRAASCLTAAWRAAGSDCCCRSSRRHCSGRCSSSSSSAKVTKASAKATSRRCSNRSSAIRCAVARSRRRPDVGRAHPPTSPIAAETPGNGGCGTADAEDNFVFAIAENGCCPRTSLTREGARRGRAARIQRLRAGPGRRGARPHRSRRVSSDLFLRPQRAPRRPRVPRPIVDLRRARLVARTRRSATPARLRVSGVSITSAAPAQFILAAEACRQSSWFKWLGTRESPQAHLTAFHEIRWLAGNGQAPLPMLELLEKRRPASFINSS